MAESSEWKIFYTRYRRRHAHGARSPGFRLCFKNSSDRPPHRCRRTWSRHRSVDRSKRGRAAYRTRRESPFDGRHVAVARLHEKTTIHLRAFSTHDRVLLVQNESHDPVSL